MGAVHVWWQRVGGNSLISNQVCCELKSALKTVYKNKLIKQENNEGEISIRYIPAELGGEPQLHKNLYFFCLGAHW